MAVENLTATGRGEKPLLEGVTTRPGLNLFESAVTVAAAASVGSTYVMARVPTNLRLSSQSNISIGALADTGVPTLKTGIFPVNANFAADDDALNAGIDAKTAATQSLMSAENGGKYVWEMAGLSADPGGFADIKVTVAAAPLNTGGPINLSLAYTAP